jgi:tubulin monoglycylase TTLL3/8
MKTSENRSIQIYILQDELNEFVENFRITACVSFLKWLVEAFDANPNPYALMSDEGKVPISAITFAMNRCKDFLDYSMHNDIDIEEEVKVNIIFFR